MEIAICGYGNLGRAAEKLIEGSKDNLVGIFSRRSGVESQIKTPVYPFESLRDFKDKIDVVLMCTGSEEDLLWQSPEVLKNFNIVDTFDTHALTDQHRQTLEGVSGTSNKTAIYSCGWDPGFLSIIRTLCNGVLGGAHTFWGKGVSQGHSEALRNIGGIKDAIQFTIPSKEAMRAAAKFEFEELRDIHMHERHCYICLDGTRTRQQVESDILQTPNYFKGQKVVINEVSAERVRELRKRMYHKGYIFAGNKDYNFMCKLSMVSNPEFTARIMIAYAHAIPNLGCGVYSPLDIPLGALGDGNRYL